MGNSIRHTFFAVMTSVIFVFRFASGSTPARTNAAATPFIHVTDLYRPHIDPDDHWDLACVYALAHRGDIDLKAIVIDYRPADRPGHNPDIAAVAQMNRITGLSVPIAVGSPHAMKSRDDTQSRAGVSELQAVCMILDVLRASERPVVITVTGCSRDVAVAGRQAPGLFARKCAGIYLNAGTALTASDSSTKLEYNVTLDKIAYAAVFDLPCSVYWMPCFEGTESDGGPLVREYASHYRFRQGQMLPHLSARARNYFGYVLGRRSDHNWLGYLEGTPDTALLAECGDKDRHMWCTAGLLHAAGYAVTREGKTPRRTEAQDLAVFDFEPIEVTCADSGVAKWSAASRSSNRFIFHVRDREAYQAAMTKAMKALLTQLP
jgi:hypothetical protein